jgi:CheY-like chemotaxis protein
VELMGGHIWVQSELGRGSTFHVELVLDVVPAPVAPYRERRQPGLTGKQILIVDDNATNRDILVRQTRSWGIESQDTGSPHTALTWIRTGRRYDVAIVDMQMEGMDGATLAREIHAVEGFEDLPIVILTSLGRRPEDAAWRREFAAFLTKPVRPSELHDSLVNALATQRVPAPEPRTPGPPARSRRSEEVPLRILVAEDNAVNQELAVFLLEKLGYQPDLASNGVEVLEALGQRAYDVVLMDVQMPEMDGLEAARRVRAAGYAEQPYIVAVTANALEGDRDACLAAGMDDYIAKPIQVDELREALTRAGSRGGRPVA